MLYFYRLNLFFLKKVRSFFNHSYRICLQRKFAHCGKNVSLDPLSSSFCGCENMTFGNDVFIGPRALFYSTGAKLIIGNKVTFGPNVSIITGNHRIDQVGVYISDVKEKIKNNDQDVIIEDDVWVGCNVTILKGVVIHRGCVLAAGSVVTTSSPPYSIIGGVPSKILKYRFTPEEIVLHEKKLKRYFKM